MLQSYSLQKKIEILTEQLPKKNRPYKNTKRPGGKWFDDNRTRSIERRIQELQNELNLF